MMINTNIMCFHVKVNTEINRDQSHHIISKRRFVSISIFMQFTRIGLLRLSCFLHSTPCLNTIILDIMEFLQIYTTMECINTEHMDITR